MRGGRFNRKGRPALYLSLDVMTSVLECAQGLVNRLPPMVLCEYDVDCESIADLRDDASRAALSVREEDIGCAWLSYQLAGRNAPSWLVAERLETGGCVGLLAPSYAPGAGLFNHNLVLWRWGADLPHKVEVYDPTGRLPVDQRSWR